MVDKRPIPGALLLAHRSQAMGYARCLRIPLPGGYFLPLCARCTGIYPLAFAVLAAGLAGLASLGTWAPWVLWVLPVPAVAEAVTDWLGWRQGTRLGRVLTGLPLGVALGGLLFRYLHHPGDPLFWAVVGVYGALAGAAAIAGALQLTVRSPKC